MSKSGSFLRQIGLMESINPRSVSIYDSDSELNIILEDNKIILDSYINTHTNLLENLNINFDNLNKFIMSEFLISTGLDLEIKEALNIFNESLKRLEQRIKQKLIERLRD